MNRSTTNSTKNWFIILPSLNDWILELMMSEKPTKTLKHCFNSIWGLERSESYFIDLEDFLILYTLSLNLMIPVASEYELKYWDGLFAISNPLYEMYRELDFFISIAIYKFNSSLVTWLVQTRGKVNNIRAESFWALSFGPTLRLSFYFKI